MSRQCFPCTACCEGWLKGDVNGEEMKPGKPCLHLVSQGCGIYEKRPENPCVKFNCAWIQSQYGMPEHMKPSVCGAIVMLKGSRGKQFISAIPVGKKIPDDTLEWLKALARERSLPLVFSERITKDDKFVGIREIGYGPPAFIKAVKSRIGPEDIMTF